MEEEHSPARRWRPEGPGHEGGAASLLSEGGGRSLSRVRARGGRGSMEDYNGLSDEKLLRELPALGEIPRELHSDYREGRFVACTVCEESLLDGRTYQIQKAFVERPAGERECTFELAVCLRCARDLSKEYSDESKEAIRLFQQRSLQFNDEDHCDFCPAPREQFGDYTIIGTCRSDSMISDLVYMCEKCCEELQECLSESTRDVHGRFLRNNFPGVPEFLDVMPRVDAR